MTAVALAVTQLQVDEGFKSDVYDDSNGAPLFTHGQPTIGYGCRCRQWSKELAKVVLTYQVQDIENQLLQFSWYRNIEDTVREAALLNMAFNVGVSGLTKGFPNMVNAIAAHDWITASEQCHVKDKTLDNGRYQHIRYSLLVGGDV